MKTIVILGAAGRIGSSCVHAFAQNGWCVRAVARGAKPKALPDGVEAVAADAFDQSALNRACAGADVVLHAMNPAYDKWAETVLPLGAAALAAAKAAGATLMVPGNAYNFGRALAMNMNESTGFEPRENKGVLRCRLEEMFERAAREDGVQTIIIRAGDFFGGKSTGSWVDLMILKDLKKGRFTWPGQYDVPHAFAYLPDLAETFVRVADRRDLLPAWSRLHFAGHTVTGQQFFDAAEAAAGRKLKAGRVPWPVLRAVGLFNPIVREVVKMKYLWDVPHSLSDTKLGTFIGNGPHTAFQEAVRRSIADLKLA